MLSTDKRSSAQVVELRRSLCLPAIIRNDDLINPKSIPIGDDELIRGRYRLSFRAYYQYFFLLQQYYRKHKPGCRGFWCSCHLTTSRIKRLRWKLRIGAEACTTIFHNRPPVWRGKLDCGQCEMDLARSPWRGRCLESSSEHGWLSHAISRHDRVVQEKRNETFANEPSWHESLRFAIAYATLTFAEVGATTAFVSGATLPNSRLIASAAQARRRKRRRANAHRDRRRRGRRRESTAPRDWSHRFRRTVTRSSRWHRTNRARAAWRSGIAATARCSRPKTGVKGKPSPEVHLAAARALVVALDDCLVWEDAPADIAADAPSGASVIVVRATRAVPTQPDRSTIDTFDRSPSSSTAPFYS